MVVKAHDKVKQGGKPQGDECLMLCDPGSASSVTGGERLG